MRFSSPTLYSALGACFLHTVALGFAATLLVTAPQFTLPPIKVRLVQPAAPLSTGERKNAGEPMAVLEEKLKPVPDTGRQVHSQLKSQTKLPPVQSSIVKVKKAPTLQPKKIEPPIETTQNPLLQERPPQVAAITPLDFAGLPAAEAIGSSLTTDKQERENSSTEGQPNGRTPRGHGSGGDNRNAARPDYRVNPKPLYPLVARRLGAQGIVLLRVQVREDGSVAEVEMAQSSGFSLLDESATRTVRESWQFLPARVEDGTPVVSWVEVPIRFVLEDS